MIVYASTLFFPKYPELLLESIHSEQNKPTPRKSCLCNISWEILNSGNVGAGFLFWLPVSPLYQSSRGSSSLEGSKRQRADLHGTRWRQAQHCLGTGSAAPNGPNMHLCWSLPVKDVSGAFRQTSTCSRVLPWSRPTPQAWWWQVNHHHQQETCWDSPAHLCYPTQVTPLLSRQRDLLPTRTTAPAFSLVSVRYWKVTRQMDQMKFCILDAATEMKRGSPTVLLVYSCCWPLQPLFQTVKPWYNSKYVHLHTIY